jgi:molybdopterin-guanine dinucleotide biosynthesis protein MobB
VKIIHVAGTSGTGKTRFISELVPALEALGPTGVVKHIGHHTATLEPGKDTTIFFESGAAISAGIDREKSVIVTRENELSNVLSFLSDSGMLFAVVEGFKQRPFKKIVFGTLPDAEQVLMIEPSIREVLARLEEFSDFFTARGLDRNIRSSCAPTGTTFVFTLSSPQIKEFPNIYAAIDGHEVKGVSKVLLWSGADDEIYLGVCAGTMNDAIEAMRTITDLLQQQLVGEETV